MINVKITMVDGSEYNIRNGLAASVHDFHKMVIAPYGTNLALVEIIKGTLISVANIISIREMDDEEVISLDKPDNEEVEEVTGLNETEIKVEKSEEVEESAPVATE